MSHQGLRPSHDRWCGRGWTPKRCWLFVMNTCIVMVCRLLRCPLHIHAQQTTKHHAVPESRFDSSEAHLPVVARHDASDLRKSVPLPHQKSFQQHLFPVELPTQGLPTCSECATAVRLLPLFECDGSHAPWLQTHCSSKAVSSVPIRL